jgi:C4-dicarboxylate-specific signal transduction histidine kinase
MMENDMTNDISDHSGPKPRPEEMLADEVKRRHLRNQQILNAVGEGIVGMDAQAIEKQGEISIITREVGSNVGIVVSDTGQGIDEKNVFRIFDPFFTTKEVGKGTGLGLNVTYNIVKKHHGTVDVQSEPGKGTTFTVRMPVGGPPALPSEPENPVTE